jgi:hypothetical protein
MNTILLETDADVDIPALIGAVSTAPDSFIKEQGIEAYILSVRPDED